MAVLYSLTDFNGVEWDWVGLDNFARFPHDRMLRRSIGNVLKLLVGNLITGVLPPFLVAEILFRLRSRKAGDFFRTGFLIPTLVPVISIIMTWRFIYHYRHGLINSVLTDIGLEFLVHDWLGSIDTALIALIFVNFPWVSAASMLILLAALLDIPRELIDSFMLDSNSTVRRMLKLDVPYIMGALRLVIVLSIIGTLQGLNFQLAMTGGGPAGSTMVPAYHMYGMAFFASNYGYASAIGFTLFVLTMAMTILTKRFLRSGFEYDPG
jgi:ABC-type sugar transport system permease subunit